MRTTPSSWRRVKLGDVCRIKHGFAFKGEYFSDSGPYIVLTPGNFYEEGGFRSKGDKEKHYIGSVPSGYILRQGDLIIAMTEQTEGLLGSSALVPEDDRYLHNQRLGLVTDLDGVDRNFLYYLFNTGPVRNQIQSSANGAKVRHTSPGRILDVVADLPAICDQRKIAAILSGYDDLIENFTRRIEILEQIVQALYREWFVDFESPGGQSVDLVETPLGPAPRGWQVQSFSAIAQFVNGYAFKPTDWVDTGIPIIKIRELKQGVTAQTPRYDGPALPAKYNVNDGDILFSWSADLDAYLWAGGSAVLNQHLFRVIPTAGLSQYFLFFALKQHMGEFRARSLGATMHHIKRSALDQVQTLVPPAELQLAFDAHVEPILSLVQNLRTRSGVLTAARDLLLPKLISGEVDVSEVDIETAA